MSILYPVPHVAHTLDIEIAYSEIGELDTRSHPAVRKNVEPQPLLVAQAVLENLFR